MDESQLEAGPTPTTTPPTQDLAAAIDAELQEALADAIARTPRCSGYFRDRPCGAVAVLFQYLIDDPTAYCAQHAVAAIRFWDAAAFRRVRT